MANKQLATMSRITNRPRPSSCHSSRVKLFADEVDQRATLLPAVGAAPLVLLDLRQRLRKRTAHGARVAHGPSWRELSRPIEGAALKLS